MMVDCDMVCDILVDVCCRLNGFAGRKYVYQPCYAWIFNYKFLDTEYKHICYIYTHCFYICCLL